VLTIPASDSFTATAANLTSLAGALALANVIQTVDSLRDVTIFAPSNAAFQSIGSGVASLTTEQLTSILEYHVVQGTVGYSTMLSNTTLKAVNDANVTITIENGTIFVNSAKVVTPNDLVSNGVVHVIDGYVQVPCFIFIDINFRSFYVKQQADFLKASSTRTHIPCKKPNHHIRRLVCRYQLEQLV
jgi:hypothetical protein